jgi:glycosyltransferase involved in cell wall biosynthesis
MDSLPPASGIPLASLRAALDDDARACHWSIGLDATGERVLVLPAPGRLTFPVRLDRPAVLTVALQLLEREWRDGTGAIAARVDVNGSDGQTQAGRAVTLATGRQGGARAAVALRSELPAGSTGFALVATKLADGPQAASNLVWRGGVLGGGDLTITPPPPRPVAAADLPAAAQDGGRPLFSVLCPVHDPPAQILAETIASVRAQRFADWELCLVDDGSRNPAVRALLDAEAAADPRIRLQRLPRPGGISAATNAALAAARGEYVALLDHDDLLTEDALAQVAAAIAADPALDMIYTDEAILRDGEIAEHYLKPGWAPESMCSLMFTCHLGVYRRSLAREIGGFRSALDGAQDHDFTLRIAEATGHILHLPEPLYRWRAHGGSTAGGGEAKPYAAVRGRAAVAAHLERRSIPAAVRHAGTGYYAVDHRLAGRPRLTVVMVAVDREGADAAVASWADEPGVDWDVILVDPGGDEIAALAHTAAGASGDHLLLLTAPAAGIVHGWMARLLGFSAQAQIAAAVPTLIAANGQIHDAGVAMPAGIPLALTHGLDASTIGCVTLNVLAAGSGLMTSRAVYERLGGLDPALRSLALTDYCLRGAAAGLRSVSVPEARLWTAQTVVAPNDLTAISRLHAAWRDQLGHDPYYNPGYRDDRGDFVPRAELSGVS